MKSFEKVGIGEDEIRSNAWYLKIWNISKYKKSLIDLNKLHRFRNLKMKS